MQHDLKQILLRYNSIYKDTNAIYHALARSFGLSDCAFWVLYLLREGTGPYTQAGLCSALALSRQTVNSAIKSLQDAGCVELRPLPDDRKSKALCLTEAGRRLAADTVDQVVEAELRTLCQFDRAMLEQILAFDAAYAAALREQVRGLTEGTPPGGGKGAAR